MACPKQRFQAESNGLQYDSGGLVSYPSVSGTYRSREVFLKNIRCTHGKKRGVIYTDLTLSLNNGANIWFGLYEQGLISEVGKALGVQDVRTGDQVVDKRFVIKSRPEDFALRLFASSSLRKRLLQVKPINLTVESNQFTFKQRSMINHRAALQFLLDLLVDMAEMVEGG